MEAKNVVKFECQCIYNNPVPAVELHTVACWEYYKGFKAGYHQREIDPLDKEDRCEKCYEQGIKEVVDWIDHSTGKIYSNIIISSSEWEVKKKEWGIK